VEILFVFSYKAFDNIGLAIAAISLLISFFTLPLYYIADKIQKKERDQRKALEPGIKRIKKAFKGDEQHLILSTFYRQNHYHPAYALRSSLGLLIQIPFFIAAYHFLSHLPQLQGESFLFIKDLGQSDELLRIGSLKIHLLPIVMTIINIGSGIIYTKGFPLRDKLQLYGMAGIFLILLYNSPAGLVYYWILNNIFSLVKNLFYKLKKPLKLLYLLVASGTVLLLILLLVIKPEMPLIKQLILVSGALLIVLIPPITKVFNWLASTFLSSFTNDKRNKFLLYVWSLLLLWLLLGIVVPSHLIGASPIEFSYLGNVENPLSYIYYTATLLFGLFVVWPIFIYGFSNNTIKSLLTVCMLVFALGVLGNLYLFDSEYGTISNQLVFDNASLLNPDMFLSFVPLLFICVVAGAVLLVLRLGFSKFLTSLLGILVIASAVNGVYGMAQISKAYNAHSENLSKNVQIQTDQVIVPIITLSKHEPNVVVLFLDRAISSYFPLILEQFPELKNSYSGFVFYPNTVSFGAHTITGAPPILGGYEYTPDAMNARSDEKLVDKHNEASLVLPTIFTEAGYSATVLDPPIPNYKWSDDFSAFEKVPEVKVMTTAGRYSEEYKAEFQEQLRADAPEISESIQKRLPMYSFLKAMIPVGRSILYDEGRYFRMMEKPRQNDAFIDYYAVLHYLPKLTTGMDTKGAYVFLANDTTHTPIYLESPVYEPRGYVTDNSTPLERGDGYHEMEQMHYHINAAAILKIADWLDYLKDEELYNNTKIIIVSDHGYELHTPLIENFKNSSAVLGFYNPLLIMKDFEAEGQISTSNEFMTTADVPLFAVKDIIENPVNPFSNENMTKHIQKDIVHVYETPYDPEKTIGTQFSFDPTKSFSIHDSIFEESNWTPLGQE
jgi:YidC/Oxa1 family membrane protein insertase